MPGCEHRPKPTATGGPAEPPGGGHSPASRLAPAAGASGDKPPFANATRAPLGAGRPGDMGALPAVPKPEAVTGVAACGKGPAPAAGLAPAVSTGREVKGEGAPCRAVPRRAERGEAAPPCHKSPAGPGGDRHGNSGPPQAPVPPLSPGRSGGGGGGAWAQHGAGPGEPRLSRSQAPRRGRQRSAGSGR